MKKNTNILVVIIISLFLLTAVISCGASSSNTDSGTADDGDISDMDFSPEDSEGKDGGSATEDSDSIGTDKSKSVADLDDDRMFEESDSEGSATGIDGDSMDTNNTNISAGMLTAAQWDDNLNWDFWMGLSQHEMFTASSSMWGYSINDRYTVNVVSDGVPVNDLKVILKSRENNTIWITRTDNKGRANLFFNVFDEDAVPSEIVVSNGKDELVTPIDTEDMKHHYKIDITSKFRNSTTPESVLDLMFVIDTTGSMADELEYIKTELKDVIDRVRHDNGNIKIRLSCNYYRDEGDEYVLRSFPFTTDIDKVQDQISKQRADGGGDFPEAVEQALEDGIFKHDWSDSAVARLMFLVLDAPPHNTDKNKSMLHESIINACDNGIRILPLSGSGVNKQTEFLLRYFSILTGGTYIFLTNDSGIGNAHIEPTIGQYEVKPLNDLLVEIINGYINIKPITK